MDLYEVLGVRKAAKIHLPQEPDSVHHPLQLLLTGNSQFDGPVTPGSDKNGLEIPLQVFKTKILPDLNIESDLHSQLLDDVYLSLEDVPGQPEFRHCDTEHAAGDGGADGVARSGTGSRRQGQGHHAQDEGEGGHQDRPQPDPAGLDGGIQD